MVKVNLPNQKYAYYAPPTSPNEDKNKGTSKSTTKTYKILKNNRATPSICTKNTELAE